MACVVFGVCSVSTGLLHHIFENIHGGLTPKTTYPPHILSNYIFRLRYFSLPKRKYVAQNVGQDFKISRDWPKSENIELGFANPGSRENLVGSGEITMFHHSSANNSNDCVIKCERSELLEGSLQP